MAGNLLVDAGFLVALLSRRDLHHPWAVTQATQHPPPWRACEAVLSEAFHLVGRRGTPALSALLQRRAVLVNFDFNDDMESVLKLLQKSGAKLAAKSATKIVPLAGQGASAVIGFALFRQMGYQHIDACTRVAREVASAPA